MRLPLSERGRLRRISKAIERSDPWLATWLDTFSALGDGQAMPAHEQFNAAASGAHYLTMIARQPRLWR
jgi:hypothetical protein